MLKSEVTKYNRLLQQDKILSDKMIAAQSKATVAHRNNKSKKEIDRLDKAGWEATEKAFKHAEVLKKFVASMIKKYE
jgi:hypothetical protein